jgi:hypothetical protein
MVRLALLTTGRMALRSDLPEAAWMDDDRFLEAGRAAAAKGCGVAGPGSGPACEDARPATRAGATWGAARAEARRNRQQRRALPGARGGPP